MVFPQETHGKRMGLASACSGMSLLPARCVSKSWIEKGDELAESWFESRAMTYRVWSTYPYPIISYHILTNHHVPKTDSLFKILWNLPSFWGYTAIYNRCSCFHPQAPQASIGTASRNPRKPNFSKIYPSYHRLDDFNPHLMVTSLVMTNSSPWKIHPFLSSVNHL